MASVEKAFDLNCEYRYMESLTTVSRITEYVNHHIHLGFHRLSIPSSERNKLGRDVKARKKSPIVDISVFRFVKNGGKDQSKIRMR